MESKGEFPEDRISPERLEEVRQRKLEKKREIIARGFNAD